MSKISFETEQDKAIKILGEVMCECRICLATEQCNESDCEECMKGQMIRNCMNQLDDFTTLAVHRVANVEYNGYVQYLDGMRRHTRQMLLTPVQKTVRRLAVIAGCVGGMATFLFVIGLVLGAFD